MGYEINSEKDKNEYEFDLNKNFFHLKNLNSGIFLDKTNKDKLKSEYESFINMNKSLNSNINEEKFPNEKNSYNFLDFSFLNIEKFSNKNITFIYFKNVSGDFKIINLQNLNKPNKSNKYSFENLDIIETKKFSEYIELDLNILKTNKKFNIFGKKNSGKSTFLIYFLNSFLSNLKKNYQDNTNLFLLDCDSGQPLLSSPYNVSLLKINKPIFMNFFKQDISTNMDLTRKINISLKENNFDFSKNLQKEINISQNLNCQEKNFELDFSSENKNSESKKFSDLLDVFKKEKSIELIRSIFVDDNSPSNNFEIYLNALKNLFNIYKTIDNFAISRVQKELKYKITRKNNFNMNNLNYIKENLKNFLVVNTNGYTSGVGNIINSSINELIEPDYIYFIKNLKAGRLEKGEEFENLILNNDSNYNNDIITRKYKIPDEDQKGYLYNYKRLEKTTILIENSFKLKENENLHKKNFNKIYHIISNLIGDYNFNLNEENNDKIFDFSKQANFYDILNDENISAEYLVDISFDEILFSFDFSIFEPINELDVLMSINSKICTLLLFENLNEKEINENYENNEINFVSNSMNLKYFNDLSVIDSRKLNNKIFKCFAYVYNIDIIKKRIILFSKRLKEERKIFEVINKERNSGKIKNKIDFVLFRNSNLDKNLHDSIFLKEEKRNNEIKINSKNLFFENLLIKNKFNYEKIKDSNFDEEEKTKENTLNRMEINHDDYYLTRNKFNMI